MQKFSSQSVYFFFSLFSAFNQLVNEAAKCRYRSEKLFKCGSLVVRALCGAVGYGAPYHAQSSEACMAHTPDLKIVVPSGSMSAKGPLLGCIKERDSCFVLGPKVLYRSAVAEVPTEPYEYPSDKADVVQEGKDVTLVAWSAQSHVVSEAAKEAKERFGIDREIINFLSVLAWDKEAICKSVKKKGRLIVPHAARFTNGFGAEVAASVQDEGFFI